MNERCEIRLEDTNTGVCVDVSCDYIPPAMQGEIFATCPVNMSGEYTAVEPVTDSSRSFVLRIEDGSGLPIWHPDYHVAETVEGR